MTDALLEIQDLRVEIGGRRGVTRAVDGVSLTVRDGETLGLVGESGCGKTMTLRAVLGLLPPKARITGGSVRFAGTELTAAPAAHLNAVRGRQISMVFQEPMTALNPVMRVGEQIAEGPRVHLGYSRRRARERAVELMRLVGIPDPERRAAAYPHEFSGGMRQRVMIAIALACEPRLLLCDEPTTALDVTIQDQILTLLVDLCARLETGLVLVTHDLAVVAQTCRRLAVMYAGQVVETGTVADVFATPNHPYTLGLLRSVPDLDRVRSSLVPIPGLPPDLVSPPSGCRFRARCPFAQPDCADGDFPLRALGNGRATACIHHTACVEAAGREPVTADD